MPARLKISKLSKSYKSNGKETRVLSNVNLELKPQEFVSVIGPNASGKSTLLKIISGILPSDSGNIEIHGAPAYMPQEHALLPWRTVEENLFLPSDVKGVSRETTRGKINELLKEFDLEKYANQYPASLSGGTRQKIALLRTAIQDNSILLLDEPFATLDSLSRLEAQTWLLSLQKKTRASVLLITHDIHEAVYLSNTIFVLGSNPGTILKRLPVSLPLPRRREHLTMPAALALEHELFSSLV